MRILPIVEGDGELAAVPALLRRVLQDLNRHDVKVAPAQKRGELPRVLSRFDAFLQTALLERCPILWVMDYDCADCDDEAKHAALLQERANNIARGASVEFVFMVQEFESLFLADHETTRKVFADISSVCTFPADPESVRDAKGWLSRARPKGSAYKPTLHQAKLAAQLDLNRLRSRSQSFVRFHSAVERLVAFDRSA